MVFVSNAKGQRFSFVVDYVLFTLFPLWALWQITFNSQILSTFGTWVQLGLMIATIVMLMTTVYRSGLSEFLEKHAYIFKGVRFKGVRA